jgi:hypothetical protein
MPGARYQVAELAGLLAGDHPFAAWKIEGITADPPTIVELLLKEKLMLDLRIGQRSHNTAQPSFQI